ncbi:mitochondrial amidoxime-reducing component 1-like [Culicoides brevitarsis]|uniref:mitochondrial amidoxime-reducing component 1-like n=1 Tax=Culicoides brevitarsis TaxID=469753 RepID=UPI00307BE0EC
MESTITKVAAGASLVTFLAISYKKWQQNQIPRRWIQVGEISDLYFFPIKSCGKLSTREVECTKMGIKQQFLWDRSFMVIQESTNRFVTARQFPALVKLMPKIKNESILTLSAPNMEEIEVDIAKVVAKNEVVKPGTWENVPMETLDCGDDVAKWLSMYILKEEKGLRLVFYPLDYPTKPVYERSKNFPLATSEHTGALHDETSFMMINEASVEDLNKKVDFTVTPLTFRPNLVLKGPNAFDEDNFKWVKIGDEIIMRVTQQCLRCAFTVIDPETGERRSDGQPLKALKEYRQFPEYGTSPVMGIHLGLINGGGKIRVGDPVFVQG